MPISNEPYQNPIAVTRKTLREKLLDNICEKTMNKLIVFAEAECNLDTKRGTRYLVKRIEDALYFCCDHPEALSNYTTISEARKALKQSNEVKL